MSTTTPTPTRANRRTPMSDDERAERRRQEQELTERAVAQLRSTTGWQNWLKVRSQIGCRRYCVPQPAAARSAGSDRDESRRVPGVAESRVLRSPRRDEQVARMGPKPAFEEEDRRLAQGGR